MDGRITSPGWPASYPGSVDCYMNISVPANSNNRIAIYFNSFSIEAHTNCEYDYLEVWFINKRKCHKNWETWLNKWLLMSCLKLKYFFHKYSWLLDFQRELLSENQVETLLSHRQSTRIILFDFWLTYSIFLPYHTGGIHATAFWMSEP